jgi:hypothetical protein
LRNGDSGRLVVRGQRAVDEADGRVEPGLAVALHDERVVARDRLDAGRPLRRAVGRRLLLLEVGYVRAGPLALVLVPPDVGLALAPRPALRVGGRPVVEDAPVHRPHPAPLAGDVVLLVARLAAGRLVDAVLVDAGVDPAATHRGAVGLELGEAGQRGAVGDAVAVDLAQHVLGVRLVVLAVRRVVPGEVEHGPVARLARRREPLADQPPEVEEEPQLRAALARRLDRLLAPLKHPLGLGERAFLLDVRGGGHEEHLGLALLRHDLAGLDLG